MNKTTAIILGIALFIVILVFTYISMMVGYKNDESRLRISINKQTEVNRLRFDNMWKIIKKEAQVPEKYKEDFKDLIVSDNTTTYGENGLQIGGFMNTIQKSNPKFDTEMYKNLMQIIESEMKAFERDQKTLVALSEQHERLLKTFPSSFFLSGIEPIEIKLVTSGKTKQSFESGEDNDTDVFDKPKTSNDTIKK